MKNYVETRCRLRDVKAHIMTLVQAEEVNIFLPATFVINDEDVKCLHKTFDMEPVSNMTDIEAGDAMEMITSFLRNMKESERTYVFCDNYHIDNDLIYADNMLRDVKVCYEPSENDSGLNDKLMGFLIFLENKVSEDGLGYLLELEHYIEDNNPGYDTLRRYIWKMGREIHNRNIR